MPQNAQSQAKEQVWTAGPYSFRQFLPVRRKWKLVEGQVTSLKQERGAALHRKEVKDSANLREKLMSIYQYSKERKTVQVGKGAVMQPDKTPQGKFLGERAKRGKDKTFRAGTTAVCRGGHSPTWQTVVLAYTVFNIYNANSILLRKNSLIGSICSSHLDNYIRCRLNTISHTKASFCDMANL